MQYVATELNKFFGAAALATYAGGGIYAEPSDRGFNEMEYRDGEWRYRDSFMGYFKSYGREVVWFQDQPVWAQHYGGGMESGYVDDRSFAQKTYEFLKQALTTGKKQEIFQPRGPQEYAAGDWVYRSGFTGNIAKFCGNEEILFKNVKVFSHHFFGGAIVGK